MNYKVHRRADNREKRFRRKYQAVLRLHIEACNVRVSIVRLLTVSVCFKTYHSRAFTSGGASREEKRSIEIASRPTVPRRDVEAAISAADWVTNSA